MAFDPISLTDDEVERVAQVRNAVARELPAGFVGPGLGAFAGNDQAFSRRLAELGLVGLGLPAEYGGQDSSAVEKFLIFEELNAANVPILAHITTERQTGPCILRYGSDYLRTRFLRDFASAKVSFSVGFSEPDAGSDLASVRTRATKVEGGWLVNGTKVWTTDAHLNDYFAVLLRTSDREDRHDGLSQLIVDLRAPGVQINPIILLDGSHHFNEVVMVDVFVPDEMILGEVDRGWQQAMAELAFERSYPDRYMSAYPVLADFLHGLGPMASESDYEVAGELTARFMAIRHVSLSLARAVDLGIPVTAEVGLVKLFATEFVQEAIEAVRLRFPAEIDPDSSWVTEAHLAKATMLAPTATIAGGTAEMVRTVAFRGLSGRDARLSAARRDIIQDTLIDIFQDHSTLDTILEAEKVGMARDLWNVVADAGLPWIGVPEQQGGSGGSFADALSMLRWSGYFAVSLPLLETGLLGAWLLAGSGLPVPAGPISVAPGSSADDLHVRRHGTTFLASGVLHRVPWARNAEQIVALVEVDEQWHVLSADRAAVTIEPRRNIAYEPRDRVIFDDLIIDTVVLASPGIDPAGLRLRGALGRASQIAGASQYAADLSLAYAMKREAFGKPIAKFQAVQHHIVRAAGEAELAAMVTAVAGQTFPEAPSLLHVAAAKTVAGRAARIVAGAAHQVHGAIGMTQEYELHTRTRRLWSWMSEYGTELEWAAEVGRSVAAIPNGELWPTLARVATERDREFAADPAVG
jgi:alkylation response protein AidB-like acyl-CoA dehydrogenase